MKTLKFLALCFMIWSTAVFVKTANLRPIYGMHPLLALFIFIVAGFVYKIIDEWRGE